MDLRQKNDLVNLVYRHVKVSVVGLLIHGKELDKSIVDKSTDEIEKTVPTEAIDFDDFPIRESVLVEKLSERLVDSKDVVERIRKMVQS